jgi:hypothetical protein
MQASYNPRGITKFTVPNSKIQTFREIFLHHKTRDLRVLRLNLSFIFAGFKNLNEGRLHSQKNTIATYIKSL